MTSKIMGVPIDDLKYLINIQMQQKNEKIV
jgi:hypothetical protein